MVVDIKEIEGPTYSNVEFPNGIVSEKLTNALFEDVSGKDVAFSDVDFSFSTFIRGYFHHATFENCKFTGCRFEDCNFRGAKFSRCDFKYCFFDKTIVPVKEIVACAPEWPNLRRELMQILRANADSLGDVDDSRAFIREEMKARREHLRRARELREEYYIKKYSDWGIWTSVRWQSFLLWLDRNLLGYGEHIWRAVTGACVLLLIVAVAQYLFNIDTRVSLGDAINQFLDSLRYVAYLLLDMPDTPARAPQILAVMVVILRYFLIGLLVAALIRVLSHR